MSLTGKRIKGYVKNFRSINTEVIGTILDKFLDDNEDTYNRFAVTYYLVQKDDGELCKILPKDIIKIL